MTIVRTAIILLLVSATMPTFSQEQGLEAEIRALKIYCKPDIERLCSNVEPGGGQIKACLMAQKEELTVGCAEALQELKQIKKSM
ncbi:MAG: cysteine rich repeat-containing protein [Gammaproteobacteria bacterium]